MPTPVPSKVLTECPDSAWLVYAGSRLQVPVRKLRGALRPKDYKGFSLHRR